MVIIMKWGGSYSYNYTQKYYCIYFFLQKFVMSLAHDSVISPEDYGPVFSNIQVFIILCIVTVVRLTGALLGTMATHICTCNQSGRLRPCLLQHSGIHTADRCNYLMSSAPAILYAAEADVHSVSKSVSCCC